MAANLGGGLVQAFGEGATPAVETQTNAIGGLLMLTYIIVLVRLSPWLLLAVVAIGGLITLLPRTPAALASSVPLLALVGPSGAGKSSIADLLTGPMRPRPAITRIPMACIPMA